MLQFYDFLNVIGQVLFGGYFILQGIRHFMHHKNMSAYAASNGVPSPDIAIYASGALLILGGLGILLGLYIQLALWLLAIFLIPVTFMMHPFWKRTDPQQKMADMINFYKNLALLGAVFLLM